MASPRVGRMRSLTPGQTARIEGFRRAAHYLDSAFQVPGTSYRVGLDPILGLIPGIGDLVSPLFTIGILWQAHDLGIPRVVQVRMIFNVAIDAFLGVVPVIGDLFDFAWKANAKNLALLERHADVESRASAGDWVFVVLLTVVLLGLAALPFILAAWALSAIGSRLF